ncbi:hypothetical protein [Roseibacillus ishigakijimensis]|uniref:Uncharacterized protein n=1 Tax=Roseibacillus ishigakijimensis TaxID=454146 RepID=A0A934VLS9_9BACT|nr:hypothetical protein [Roseibacillus ishigakijimensis]MBK1833210.1 hypothetical protein [Roseibacillus ishigakijimensis]
MKRDDMLSKLRAQAGVIAKGKALSREGAFELLRAHYRAQDIKPRSLDYREELIGFLERTLPKTPISQWSEQEIERWWQSPESTRLRS